MTKDTREAIARIIAPHMSGMTRLNPDAEDVQNNRQRALSIADAILTALEPTPVGGDVRELLADIEALHFVEQTTFYAEGFNDALDKASELVEARAALTATPAQAESGQDCDFCDGSGEAMGLDGAEPCHKCQTAAQANDQDLQAIVDAYQEAFGDALRLRHAYAIGWKEAFAQSGASNYVAARNSTRTDAQPTPSGEVDGLVAEIDALQAEYREGSGDARQLCEVLLYDNWPRLRAALGGGWRDDMENAPRGEYPYMDGPRFVAWGTMRGEHGYTEDETREFFARWSGSSRKFVLDQPAPRYSGSVKFSKWIPLPPLTREEG